MSFAFIELYNPRPSWLALSASAQQAYVQAVVGHVEQAVSSGVEILAFGTNAHATPHRSPYAYYCVYRLPNAEAAVEFEQLIQSAGWYDYFDQANLCGPTFEVGEFFQTHVGATERAPA